MAFINIIQAFSNSGGTPQYALVDASRRIVITGDAAAIPVPVSQSGTWTVAISGSVAVTGPLTDSQLRATPVPIQGNVSSGSPASGNPIQIAGQIKTGLTGAGNVSPLITAPDGDLIVHQMTGSVSLVDTVPNTIRIPVNETDEGFFTYPVFPYYYNNTTWDRFRGSATDGLLVNLGSNNDVTVTGTITANQGGAWTVAATQSGSWTVTANAGTGTFTVADNQVITDNAAFADGTSKLFMGGYIFDEVAGTALTENDAAAARIDSKRAQIFTIEDVTTRGTRAVVRAPTANDLTGSSLTGLVVLNTNYVFDGATWDAQPGNSAGGTFVQGPAANDAAAAGNPVQVGGVFRSTPNTVEDGDVGSFNIDDQQNILTGVRRTTLVLTAINTTYNNVTTTATSASLDCNKFRKGCFMYSLTESGTATDITFQLQYSDDDSTWFPYREAPWTKYRFDDVTISNYGTLSEAPKFDIPARYIRMVVTATGTDATNTFTVSNARFSVYD